MKDEFEKLLSENKNSVERYVHFKIIIYADAEDVLQETYLTAYRRFNTLKNKDSFKAWIISIAKNKCNDYFKAKAQSLEIPLDNTAGTVFTQGRMGIIESAAVHEALDKLKDKNKQMLYLYFFKELPLAEIAKKLEIPLGTVKSRLYYAKKSFKQNYKDLFEVPKGEGHMNKLPEYLPEYKIERSDKKPFSVRWEELMGWMIVPKIGEKLTWGLYDFPSRKRTEYTEMEVLGKAEVHGIEGVEIKAVQHDSSNSCRTGRIDRIERRFVAQLTDTHSRYLAESHTENGIKKLFTFLDGDSFLNNWGFGDDNCGNKINISAKGVLKRSKNTVTGDFDSEALDIVGRYTVTINKKTYDTVCVMDINCYNDAIVTEQFLDKNGRTVLWRRFNRDDWAFDRYNRKWTGILPDNERLEVNGKTYVHWYDCISDYIL